MQIKKNKIRSSSAIDKKTNQMQNQTVTVIYKLAIILSE